MEILAAGFKDGTGRYLTDHKFTGVWLADRPLDENEGCKGSTVLAVSGLDQSDIADYEWIEEGRGYREWLVPAAMLNGKVTVELENHWRPSERPRTLDKYLG